MKSVTCFLLSATMTTTILAGWGSQSGQEVYAAQNDASQKERVVVACWGNQMLDSYTEYLCDLFPEV